MRRRLSAAVFAMGVLTLIGGSLRGQGPVAVTHSSSARDSAAALAVFRENIDAIHTRDHPRYLRTYVHTPGLTLGGLRGMNRTWMSWSARTDTAPARPDTFIFGRLFSGQAV